MALQNAPNEYFTNIDYNPSFYESTSTSEYDLLYLKKTGIANSTAVTTFSNSVVVPTMILSDSSTNVSTTAFVKNQLYATLSSVITSINNIFSGTNSWTGTNSFNTNLPTTNLTPSLSYQFITKLFGDNNYGVKMFNNTWSGQNIFNVLPTSTVVPTLSNELTNKSYVDSTFGDKALSNDWLLQQNFNGSSSVSGTLYMGNSSGYNNISYNSINNGVEITCYDTGSLNTSSGVNPSLYWDANGVTLPLLLTCGNITNTHTFAGITNDNQVSTTAYLSNYYAPINSPNFSGIPTCDNAIIGTNSRQIATTNFVQTASIALLGLANTWSGTSNTFDNDIYVNSIQMGQGNTANLNTCFGQGCLSNNIGTQNTSTGYFSMASNTSGNNNTAYGMGALESNTTGSNNIAIGYLANQNGNFDNTTCIGASTIPTSNNQIVLGTSSETTIISGALDVSGNTVISGALNVSGISTFSNIGNNNLIPVGTIISTIVTINSYGYLRCDGTMILGTTTYPLLFNAIGFQFNTVVVTTGVKNSSGLYNGTIGAYTIQGQAGGISGLSVGMYAPYNNSIGYAYVTAINIITFVITLSSPLISTFTSITVNWYNPSKLNYRLPDLRGSFLRGIGQNSINTSYTGQAIGLSAIDTIQSHTHTTLSYGTGATSNQQPITSATINPANITTTTSSNPSGNISTETKPFNYSVYYYIRYL